MTRLQYYGIMFYKTPSENLDNSMLIKRTQPQKATYFKIPFM